ncbi:MAG: hypothetical protein ACLSHC_14915 [Bilophila wadsworthia]
MAETFHVRNMLETAIIRTVEKIEPARCTPTAGRGRKEGRQRATYGDAVIAVQSMLMFSLGALRA